MLKNFKIIISGLVGIMIGIGLDIVLKKYTTLHIESDVSFEINPLEIFSIFIKPPMCLNCGGI